MQCICHDMNLKKEPKVTIPSGLIESTHSSHSTTHFHPLSTCTTKLGGRAVIPMFSPCIFSRSSKEYLEKMSLEANRRLLDLQISAESMRWTWLDNPNIFKQFWPTSQLRQIVGFVLMHDLVLESECFG